MNDFNAILDRLQANEAHKRKVAEQRLRRQAVNRLPRRSRDVILHQMVVEHHAALAKR